MSGLLGLLGTIGSSILTNRGAKSRQQQADAQNVKFWQMQNKYNEPLEQMKRLEKAGLNPALIYGSGQANTGVAGSVAPSKPAPYNVKDPTPATLQSMLIGSEIRLKDTQSNKNIADAKEKNTLLQTKLQRNTLQNIGYTIKNSNLDRKEKAAISLVLEQAAQYAITNKEAVSQNKIHDKLRSMGVNPKASTEIANLLQSGTMLIDQTVNDLKELFVEGLEAVQDKARDVKDVFEFFNNRKNKK